MLFFIISLALINILIISAIKVYCKLTTGICKCSNHLVGKTTIVTGGNKGIGYETAKNLAERGARVLLACRNEGLGIAARDKIIKTTGNTDVHYRNLDLSSLASVRAFADGVIKTEKRLDILVNNAGVFDVPNIKTEDGLSLAAQTNHFGPFLLTNLLLPLLKTSAPSRIVSVSSGAHKNGKVEFDNLNAEKETTESYSMLNMYANTKLFNILMTVELERILKGTGVTANCLHPGVVETEILQLKSRLVQLLLPLVKYFFKDSWEGAQTSIYLSVSREVDGVSGKYYADCRETKVMTKLAEDKNLARKLWEVSEKLVGLK
ncbi:hypothetical protein PYW07_001680 [Mythimna separata]|uniref:Uncharacterized protein n=1 Tax=Mythimna separata TaxID=271217 RepID=A0AAD7YTL1_MYTSE|nr:hypothetical protein PYW07_001680 [Mythimna separata]